jgi:hypothetical protein
VVFAYADEMFQLDSKFQDVLVGRMPGSTLTLKVVVDMVGRTQEITERFTLSRPSDI